MLKKYLLIFTFLLIIFSLNKSFAFLDKTQSSTFLTNINYDNLHVVSNGDFDDNIQVQIQDAAPNTSYDVQVNYNKTGYINLTTVTTDNNGSTTISTTKNWSPWTPSSNSSGQYTADFKARPTGNSDPTAFTQASTYTANVSYINTGISNTAGITNNGTVAKGTAVTFTCSKSSEIYYGADASWPSSAVKVQSKYDSSTNMSSDYTLTYSPTLDTAGKYHVECSNIGYNMSPSTVTDFVFTVTAPPTGSITASPNPCIIAINASTCSTQLTWSTTNPVDTSVVKAGATTIATANSNSNFSATVPYSGQTFTLYNNGSSLGSVSVTTSCASGSSWDGSKCLANPNPSGSISATACTIATNASTCNTQLTWSTSNGVGTSQVTSDTPSAGTVVANGNSGSNVSATVYYSSRTFYLYNNGTLLTQVTANATCASGSSWDGSKCAKIDNCPAAYPSNPNGGNPVCGSPTVNCNFVLPGQDDVSCQVNFICVDGVTIPNIKTANKNGTTTDVTSPFPWIADDYQYEFYCPDSLSPKVIAPALNKTYSHFQTFNLSTNSIQKGGGINLNWIVEEPNSSCKIVGTAIRTNAKVFDTKDSMNQEHSLDNYIATTTNSYNSNRKNIAIGEYKGIIGSYWIVNQSTKFVASCIDTGNYKPGTYQIIKEVYVIGENE